MPVPRDTFDPAAGDPPRKQLLVIDDDTELCALLAEFLEREGFGTELVHDGVRGLEAALEGHHQAIILDVMLPGLPGFEVLRRIRERMRTPVLMLTARGDQVDRVVGLEMGADDYVPKPFDPRELAARVRAVLRRTESPAQPDAGAERIVVGAIVVDPGAREAWCGTRGLTLTPVEFDLLLALARSAGRVSSRDELSRTVLGRAYDPSDRSVDTHVSNLRRKLGTDSGGAPLIRTVRGAGYMLVRVPARAGI
jgi:two-component system response regulator CpxR